MIPAKIDSHFRGHALRQALFGPFLISQAPSSPHKIVLLGLPCVDPPGHARHTVGPHLSGGKQAGWRAADTLKHATRFPKIDTDFGPMRKGRNAWQGFSLYPEPLTV
ncbi:hypothetical protein [Mesorhizobium sp.]|uniref:hypothetical protein n=1 Tax=Mesorhizobium sp. TaxID=1871066 RepID=UPI00257C6237|nr:hypothetical protein [Mesorhizobium sp.]